MLPLVLIQSRTSSRRLPAKALLPVAGMPSAVLCARRAANTGARVLVATSVDATDDALAQTLAEHGIAVFRGPLDDVLARMTLASAGQPDDAPVIRLTADNLFPDGALIEELVQAFAAGGAPYMGPNLPLDGLPHGISLEIFTARLLRETEKQAHTAYDREHVTPFMRRAFARSIFRPDTGMGDLSHWRVTMDHVQDYDIIRCVFGQVSDPVQADWRELCRLYQRVTGAPFERVPFHARHPAESTLTLDAAQLGMGRGEAPDDAQEPERILEHAMRYGVSWLDVSGVDGCALERIGRAMAKRPPGFRILSPLGPLGDLPPQATQATVDAFVDAAILGALRTLKRDTLDAVVARCFLPVHIHHGLIWQRLRFWREKSAIAMLGACVRDPQEVLLALASPDVQRIRILYHPFDQRWLAPAIQDAMAARPEVVICAHSPLLQSVLGASPGTWPHSPALANALERLVARFNRKSVQDLCLAYARSMPFIASIAAGARSLPQWAGLIACFREPLLDDHACREMEASLSDIPAAFIDSAP